MYQEESWKPFGLVLDDPTGGPVRGWAQRITAQHNLVAEYLTAKPFMATAYIERELSYFDVLGAAERWARRGRT